MGQAFYYVTGPVDCYVRIPTVGAGPFVTPTQLRSSGGTPTFLGHTQKTPEPTYEPKYKPVFSSQGGEAVPADKVYMGTDVKVVLNLQRFDWDVLQALLAAPRYGRGTDPGTETYLDVGALLQRNGLGVELWLRNAFYGTVNAAAYPDMPIGTYFVCCNLAAVYPQNLTRDAANVQLLFEANWVQIAPSGNRVCFTSDPDYFATLPAAG